MASSLGETINSALERHQAGDFDTAEALYRAVLGEDPDNLNGLQLLGLLIHQRGRAAVEAVALLEKAIAVLERRGNAAACHAALHNNLGNALRAAGRGQEAAAAYRRGLELDPDVTELHANLGNALLGDGDLVGAIASYEAALKLTPGHGGALLNLASILIDRGTPTEALTLSWRLMTTAPDDPNSHFVRGRALGELGDNRGAIDALRA